MGGLFGGGGGGTQYIPAPAPVQAESPVQASKELDEEANKQRQLLKAQTNGGNNTFTSGLGDQSNAKTKNASLLGG